MKNITILGATGSIGLNTLNVIKIHPDKYNVFAISAKKNWEDMVSLCKLYKPEYAVMADINAAKKLKQVAASSTKVLSGKEALVEIASHTKTEYVMAAIVGSAGIEPTIAAAKAGKRIMLANKESFILAGDLFMQTIKKYGAEIMPVDSEHSAIFQCLESGKKGLKKIQLTASGGPFLNMQIKDLKNVSPEDACAHPTWNMGRKISVDSATMINKGLEVVEAHFLFGLAPDNIDVIIHPQSIIHSFIYFIDGSVMSQLALPDMRTAISYALSYPTRHKSGVQQLDLTKIKKLEFYAPDFKLFPCLKLVYEALKIKKNIPGSISAANEVAVDAFLKKEIGFLDIYKVIEKTINCIDVFELDNICAVIENDRFVRKTALSIIKNL